MTDDARRFLVTVSSPRTPVRRYFTDNGGAPSPDLQQDRINRITNDPNYFMLDNPYPQLTMTARTAKVVWEIVASDAAAAIQEAERVLYRFLVACYCEVPERRSLEPWRVAGPVRITVVERVPGVATASVERDGKNQERIMTPRPPGRSAHPGAHGPPGP